MASGLVAQLADEIACSPAGRSRMNLPERPDDDDGAFLDILE